MALHKPCGCGPLVSSPALTPPSKTPMSTVIHILRPPLKPIFRNSAVKPPRATAATPQKYVYPDPIPQFAESETQKFRAELSRRLLKEKETFGHDLHSVVDVCAEIVSEFLHREYGGPGTLLVEPFTDMLVALKEKELPGAPLAARTSLLWAQSYLDRDWETWNSKTPK
ncbi:hypothetical protein EV2_011930 [Malus domestica]|uniref:Uncharacterized protein n=1 Tax=Malus domestica TaxID=3750 RepID=A0A498IC74_MALDO|nr:hypothetical protein DVH24_040811 [Malus domestica]